MRKMEGRERCYRKIGMRKRTKGGRKERNEELERRGNGNVLKCTEED